MAGLGRASHARSECDHALTVELLPWRLGPASSGSGFEGVVGLFFAGFLGERGKLFSDFVAFSSSREADVRHLVQLRDLHFSFNCPLPGVHRSSFRGACRCRKHWSSRQTW